MEFRAALDAVFADDLAAGATVSGPSRGRRFAPANVLSDDYDRYWALPDGQTTAMLMLELPEPRTFNRILLQEYIPLGQRICGFTVEAWDGGAWTEIASGTTVGYKRILPVPETMASRLRITIDDSFAVPVLSELGVYFDAAI